MTKPQNPWPTIDPSQLRHQVLIQSPTSGAQDGTGQPVISPATVRQTWGGLNLITLKEAFGEGQLTAQETDVWTVRWTPIEIKPAMQLAFGGAVWKIQVVNNVARRNIIVHLLCIQLNAQS
jgi:head-tail adaptor